jgi:hypothetical protein
MVDRPIVRSIPEKDNTAKKNRRRNVYTPRTESGSAMPVSERWRVNCMLIRMQNHCDQQNIHVCVCVCVCVCTHTDTHILMNVQFFRIFNVVRSHTTTVTHAYLKFRTIASASSYFVPSFLSLSFFLSLFLQPIPYSISSSLNVTVLHYNVFTKAVYS